MSEQDDPTTRALAIPSSAVSGLTVLDQARVLAASGFFPDIKSISQAAAKILAGAELGFGPMASLRGVYIANGVAWYSANLLAAAIKRSRRYDYRVVTLAPDECELAFSELGQEVGRSRFTLEDARQADISSGKNAKTWDRYPRNMLFARAVTNGAKWYCAGIFGAMEFGGFADEEAPSLRAAEGRVIEGRAIERRANDDLADIIDREVPDDEVYEPPATHGDLVAIHVMARQIGWIFKDNYDEPYRGRLRQWFQVDSAKDLSHGQALSLIERMATELEPEPDPTFFGHAKEGPGGRQPEDGDKPGRVLPDGDEPPQSGGAASGQAADAGVGLPPPRSLPKPTRRELEQYSEQLQQAQRLGIDVADYAIDAEITGVQLANKRSRLEAAINKRTPPPMRQPEMPV